MSFFRLTAHALLLALLAAPSALAQPRDVKGAGDHPLVGRYDGSVATHYQVKAYEEIRLPARPLERADKDRPAAWTVELAGKLTSIRYEGPAGRSILEVMRNYEAALRAKGFEVKMFCRGEAECSPGRLITTFWEAARGGIGMPSTWDSTVYLLAERDEGGQRTTVGALGVETKASANRPLTPHVALTIVDAKKMETDKIRVIDAGELEKALDRDGRIAIYGIQFDFDKADIRPESAAQIDQLATLLKKSPRLEVLIVGHTDGQGAFDYNLSLSQRRAQAVVDTLVAAHGIDRKRLTPAGAGMAAPIATNRTDEGRARNRRVEIVERVPAR
jgi:OmpA-OmpF porin, OOP family